MESMDSLRVLNDDHKNRKMLMTLPEWLVLRWRIVVANWKVSHKGFPPFNEFANFNAREASIACDPVLLSLRQSNKPAESGTCPMTDKI